MKVRLFASYAELLGAREIVLPIEPPASVAELRLALARLYPSLPPQFGIAVNEEYATDHNVITASDDVALIPPVAGG